ncbi:type II CAAX endopeptidase family protein [Taibaiella koreensis]|uniref:type II CAAX endopeptidase family protein n=1 Tax=Taibaiella koreensis TaxID=1268548 RepID=UPI000E59FB96|nr:type II CAAX endopeptidase family protein [Taibaiella koreensis]
MFKSYLRIQPVSVQLLVFLSFWCALMLLGLFIQPLYIKAVTGIGADQMDHFLEQDIYRYPNLIFVSNTLFQVFSFLVPALIYAYLADPSPRSYLGLVNPVRKIRIAGMLVLALGLLCFTGALAEWMAQLDLGKASQELDRQREGFINAYLSSGSVWSVLRNVALIALVPAICEELFFRGVIFKFAQSIFRRWWLSIGVSSILFTLFHASISEFLPIFIAGVVLGWVYYITGSLWMSILLHLLFNGIQALIGIYATPGMEKSLEGAGPTVIAFVIGAVLIAGCVFVLYRKRTPLPAGWNVAPGSNKGSWLPEKDA